MLVEIRVGSKFVRQVAIIGPRVWKRGLIGLSPGSPEAFTELPLTLAYTYGGYDSWEGLDMPYPDNPEGRGFYLSEASAQDRPLPCIEDPDARIECWDDRPIPAGLVPIPPGSTVRMRTGLDTSVPHRPSIRPPFFNAAFPSMIARDINPGDPIRLAGVRADGLVQLRLPCHRFAARLRFDDETHTLPLVVDQIGIEVDVDRLFVAYRLPFRYQIRPCQIRTCTVIEQGFAA